jgi:type IV pilus assembly protein PilB
LDLADLGFEKNDLEVFMNALNQPQGLILVTGPTGSGKTTTLYSALSEVNDPKKNLSTAEDPVEFNIDGINQVNMNPKVGLDFASALRAFLRQDPDVILVGEIRDQETAEVAFKAASTGHLVLSTLHTNDAPSTVVRLLNMGIPGYMVTTAVSLIMAQRLVGTICKRCKSPIPVNREALISIGVPEADLGQFTSLYRGDGCAECNYTGMKGRMAIYEVMTFNDTLRDAILKNATPAEVKAAAIRGGMRSLRQAGIEKIKQGVTTIEEVFAKTIGDDEV